MEIEIEYDSSFTVVTPYVAVLSDSSSTEFIDLRRKISVAMTTACMDAGVQIQCEVHTVTFADSNSQVAASFKLNITDYENATVDVEDVFNTVVSKAEDDRLITGLVVLANTVTIGVFTKDYCEDTTCQNSGTCSELATSNECQCTPEYTGNNCELVNVRGNFTMGRQFIAAYNNVTSVTYTSLKALVKAGVEAKVNATVATSNPDAYSIQLVDVSGSVAVKFLMSLAGSVTGAQITTIFESLVAGALDDSLVPGETIIASSIVFGENTQNYCEDNSCLNGGQCSEEAEGFSCACEEGYAGDTCELLQWDGSFTLTTAYSEFFALSVSNQYIALRDAIKTGIEDDCVTSDCTVSPDMTFADSSGQTAVSFTMTISHTRTTTQQQALFDSLVEGAEDGDLITGHTVVASTLLLGPFNVTCEGRCQNSGTCEAGSSICTCPGGFVNNYCQTTAVRITLNGRLRLDSNCTADSRFLVERSEEYQHYRSRISIQIEFECRAAGKSGNIICRVSAMTFSCGSVDVDFTLTVEVPPGTDTAALLAAIEENLKNNTELFGGVLDVSLAEVPAQDGDDDGLGAGAIAGIIIGVLAFVAVLIGLTIFVFVFNSRRSSHTANIHRGPPGRFADEDSNSSNGGGYYHKRPELLFWQSGNMARSITSYDRYQIDGSYRPEYVDQTSRRPVEHRTWDVVQRRRNGSEADRFPRYADRYSDVSSERSYRYPYYGGSRYYDYYNPTARTYDRERLQTITDAVYGTSSIDWSAMRNFKRARGGQGSVSNEWDWRSYY